MMNGQIVLRIFLLERGENKEAKNILRDDEWSNSYKDIFTWNGVRESQRILNYYIYGKN